MPLATSGAGAFLDRSGGWLTAETAQSAPTVIFKLVMSGLTSAILTFRYSLSSVPGSVCSHFFVASSQNCSSSCCGQSLVIMELTSPPGVSASIRQLTGCSSACYLQPLRKHWRALALLSDYMIIMSSPLTVSFVSAFLTSPIKLILWLKFSTDRRQAKYVLGAGGRGQGP